MLKKLLFAVLVLIIASAAVFSAGCINTDDNNPDPVPTCTPTAEPTHGINVANQGEVLMVEHSGNKAEISIDSKIFGSNVVYILTGGHDAPPEGRTYVMLEVTTKYVDGSSPNFIIDPKNYAVYVNGISYKPSVPLTLKLPDEFDHVKYDKITKTNILKGAKYTGWLIYDLPIGDELLGFEYNGDLLGLIKVNC